MTESLFQQGWRIAAQELGVSVEIPFKLQLNLNETIHIEVLVKDFGAPNGMLLLHDYALIAEHTDEIQGQGYGYYVLGDAESWLDFTGIRDDLLKDWGWCGPAESKPCWLG